MDKEEKGKIIVEFNKVAFNLRKNSPAKRIMKAKIYDEKKIEQNIKNLFVVENSLLCKITYSVLNVIDKISFQGNEEKTTIDSICGKHLNFSFNEIVFENIVFNLSKFDCEDLFKLFLKSSELNISFKNCVFNSSDIQRVYDIKFKKLYFDNCEFNDKLSFDTCVFDIQFFISNSRVSDKFKNSNNEFVVFNNCMFNYIPEIKIRKSQNYELLFKKPTFNKKISFSNNVFDNKYKQVKFENAIFKDIEFNFEYGKNTFEQDILFVGSKFENIAFCGIEIKSSINFDTCTFNKEFEYDDKLFHQDKVSFNNSTFNDSFVVRSNSKEINRELSFKNVKFNKDFKLDNLKINKNIIFTEAEFNGNLYINNCEILENIVFTSSKFKQNLDFANSTFKNFVDLDKVEIGNVVNFNSTIFQNTPILSLTHMQRDTIVDITFMQIIHSSIEDMEKSIPNYLKLKKQNIDNKDKLEVIVNLRETYRIFKDILINKHNTIDASRYKNIELYLKELEYKYQDKVLDEDKNNKFGKLSMREQLDWILLKLNRIVSDHHSDLFQIIIFTLSMVGGYVLIDYIFFERKEIIDFINQQTEYLKVFFFFSVLIAMIFALFFIFYYFLEPRKSKLFIICKYIMHFIVILIVINIVIREDDGVIYAVMSYVFIFNVVVNKTARYILMVFGLSYISYLLFKHGYFLSVAYIVANEQLGKFKYFLIIVCPSLLFIAYIFFVVLFYKIKELLVFFALIGIVGIYYSPSIITPFLGAFSEDTRNHYLYKAIDELDDKKALELARIILPNDKDLKEFEPNKTILSKNAKLEQISIFDKTDLSVNFIYEQSNQDKNKQSVYKAKKTLKDYKDELKSSKLLEKSPELKRAVAIDGGVSRLNIAYYLVLAFCIFALQKTMRKNSIIPS
ncbi:hypothetical protein AVANS14531_07780 [Campylobacter sp. Cr9]|uniref:hypothetical protein n=1 Tax=Campylobacter sp. Cr9 TaxID=2735728 RepID=UPI003014D96C|nr:hypothetical protein [Campylobacter sp. Cr9]